jgi:hypothetical protein
VVATTSSEHHHNYHLLIQDGKPSYITLGRLDEEHRIGKMKKKFHKNPQIGDMDHGTWL